MTESRFKFLIRWVYPPMVSAIAFTLGFLYNLIPEFGNAELILSEVIFAFLATFFGGAFCGFAYSLYRPFFRRLGRILGDVLTGAISMNFYFMAIYEFMQYHNYSQGLADGLIGLLIMATILGGFAGWIWNISKIENDLIEFMHKRLT